MIFFPSLSEVVCVGIKTEELCAPTSSFQPGSQKNSQFFLVLLLFGSSIKCLSSFTPLLLCGPAEFT